METVKQKPDDFVYLPEIAPSILYDIKYATDDNLIGRPVLGYQQNVCLCTRALAKKLQQIQQQLQPKNISLFLFETYRPYQAGVDIHQWSQDIDEQAQKAIYYPNIDKADFYELGYVVEHSAHTRGSTVDLSLYDLSTETFLDMGTRFDFMDELSHPDNQTVSAKAYNNRQYLRQVMQQHGFSGIDTEWWHFTLQNEPYPDTYFNFPVR